MMADVECGKVGIVIVKDQSRLGRDYLQTGMLMEITFPQFDVRFIAINDGVDSENSVSDFSGIKNYFNDFYARDKAKEYLEMPKLTPELLRVFVRRIEVYEKLEKYSRTCGNPIVIHYAFQLPEQNGMPAIEQVMQPTAMTA